MNQTIHNLLTEQLVSWETARNKLRRPFRGTGERTECKRDSLQGSVQSGTYRVFRSQSRCQVHKGAEMLSLPRQFAGRAKRYSI